jgi:cell division transport system permease protein
MAIKPGYVGREVFINLGRNITLTVASILAVAISLSLGGFGLLLNVGVNATVSQFQEGVEFIVFMQPDAPQATIDAVRAELESSPQVAEVDYFDQDDAFQEFQELFADEPELVESVTADILPPSFRVKPVDAETEVVEGLAGTFDGQPGVREVVFDSEAFGEQEDQFRTLALIMFVVALISMVAAVLVIVNTVRMAIFARRREIEVMKLVGATNWFIRIPFVVEGIAQALFGAVLAGGAVWTLNRFFISDRIEPFFPGFAVTSQDVWRAVIYIGVMGIVTGAIISAVAVTRFLKV